MKGIYPRGLLRIPKIEKGDPPRVWGKHYWILLANKLGKAITNRNFGTEFEKKTQ